MSPTSLSSHHLLFDIIQSRLALTLDDHRRADTIRAVEDLAAGGNRLQLGDVIATLSREPITHAIWQKFIQIATVGETYFFRDRDQINALRLSVLPGLIAERRREGSYQLRLWSAGCSTGEEPYSLAILLREMLPDFNLWNVTILASDLNVNHLDRGRSGFYRAWSFRNETPEDVRERWFVEEEGGYRIHQSIRDMVTFAPLNFANNDWPSFAGGTMEMDIILCRNVLIYFDNEMAAAVIKRFHRALRQTGWLVLGHAETGHMFGQDYEPRNFQNAVLYQKSLDPVPTPDVVVPPPPVVPINFKASVPISLKTSGYSFSPTTIAPKPVSSTAVTMPLQDPLERARLAANREQWAEALEWLVDAEKLHKLSPEVHYLRGVVELQQGDIDQAMCSLRKAIYCDSKFVLAYFALGEIYEKQAQYKKAHYHWRQAEALLAVRLPEEPVLFSEDLTVEMLKGLLHFRCEHLPA